jgi:hypothetical protein
MPARQIDTVVDERVITMLRLALIVVGLALLATGVAELISLVSRGLDWSAVLWAALALISGLVLTIGAWRSDPDDLARLFKRR